MLIFSNGTAYFNVSNSNKDINDFGMPIEGGDYVLSVRCYIEAQSENKSGKNEDGFYPNGSYSVSFDYDSVPSNFSPTKVRLEHERKGNLGEFTIQRTEFYNLTRTIQIWI